MSKLKHQKMHLRDWIAWEIVRDLRTLCGIPAASNSENIAKNAIQEANRIRSLGVHIGDSKNICNNCHHSYFSLTSQLRRASRFRKFKENLSYVCKTTFP